MTIKELVQTYQKGGFTRPQAESNAAQEIILRKIASSPLCDKVLLKGGVVMYNITNNNRRATQDLDFDFVRYDISNDESIDFFVSLLNDTDKHLVIKRIGKVKTLHQADYKGKRVQLSISDSTYELFIHLDIGVHTLMAIEQTNIIFTFNQGDISIKLNANPIEQIVAEKLVSLAKHNYLSTRFKDIGDIYYLINNCKVNKNTILKCIELFLLNDLKGKTLYDFILSIEMALNDSTFADGYQMSQSTWIDEEYGVIRDSIINFLYSL